MESPDFLKSHKNISNLRDLMPALQNKFYFNYGGQGPLPTKSLTAIKNSWKKIQELGPFTDNVWSYLKNEINLTKTYLERICGVTKYQIAFTENTTSGCILPLWGLPLEPSKRILISDCEHPGIIAACKELARRKKLKIDILKVRKLRYGLNDINLLHESVLNQIEKSLEKETKLIVISHVLWNTGQIMPIKDIFNRIKKHPLKPYLLVDAAQSFGQIPIVDAANNSDIYSFTGHKWAFGPEGLGGVVLSERVLKESNPTIIGWKSIQKEESIYVNNINPFHLNSQRFEIATSCTPLLAGLRCSLELLEQEGNEKERLKKIQNLSKKLWEGLNNIKNIKTILDGPPSTGLVSFILNNQQSESSLVSSLGRQKVWIRILEDPTWLRACLHITSNEKEIAKLLESIEYQTNI